MQVVLPYCSPSEEVDSVQICLKNGDVLLIDEDKIVIGNSEGHRADIPMEQLTKDGYH